MQVVRGLAAQPRPNRRGNLARGAQPPVASPRRGRRSAPCTPKPPDLAANVPPETEGMNEQSSKRGSSLLRGYVRFIC